MATEQTSNTAAIMASLRQSLIDTFTRKHADSYGSRVIADAEGNRGKTLEAAIDPGWTHAAGEVVTDGSIVCSKCGGIHIYAGACTYTGEYDRFAHNGGDPAHNLYTQDEQYLVCMTCAHVCHYPPKDNSSKET